MFIGWGGLALQDTNGRTMITPWTKDVDPNAPHPEYPRPQMQRRAWQNLNGQWEFECTSLTGTVPNLNETLKRSITVPFPVESYLSGIPRFLGSSHAVSISAVQK